MKNYSKIAVLIVALIPAVSAYPQQIGIGSAVVCPAGYVCAPTTPQYCDDSPAVPVEYALMGRQGVVKYLNHQIDHALLTYGGRSIIRYIDEAERYVDRTELSQRGYVHEGQYSEFESAFASIPFSGKAVRLPDNSYDVNCRLRVLTDDGKRIADGYGYLAIQRLTNGTLSAGTFQPNVYYNESIILPVTNFSRAVYIGTNWWDNEHGLEIVYGQGGTTIGVKLNMSQLDSGFLFISDNNGSIFGWDFAGKGRLTGESVAALLGRGTSQDVRTFDRPYITDINAGDTHFFMDGSQVLGRFPLLDVKTIQQLDGVATIQVPMWGGPYKFVPSHMYVTVNYLSGTSSNLVVGQRYEAPAATNAPGAFRLNLPPGGYQIETVFDGVKDYNSDYRYPYYYGGKG